MENNVNKNSNAGTDKFGTPKPQMGSVAKDQDSSKTAKVNTLNKSTPYSAGIKNDQDLGNKLDSRSLEDEEIEDTREADSRIDDEDADLDETKDVPFTPKADASKAKQQTGKFSSH